MIHVGDNTRVIFPSYLPTFSYSYGKEVGNTQSFQLLDFVNRFLHYTFIVNLQIEKLKVACIT